MLGYYYGFTPDQIDNMTSECVNEYVNQIHNIQGFHNVKNFKPRLKNKVTGGDNSLTRSDIIEFMVKHMYYKIPGY